MKVWVCHLPKGAWALKRWPTGDHPVRLVSLVLVDVSSIKINRATAWLKKRRRRLIHRSRACAISGRSCSLALRLFFIAQTKPVEKTSDRGTMDMDAALGKFDAQFVQRHFAIAGNTLINPMAMRCQSATKPMALSCRRKRACRSMQDHHVVDEPR